MSLIIFHNMHFLRAIFATANVHFYGAENLGNLGIVIIISLLLGAIIAAIISTVNPCHKDKPFLVGYLYLVGLWLTVIIFNFILGVNTSFINGVMWNVLWFIVGIIGLFTTVILYVIRWLNYKNYLQEEELN